MRPHRFSLIVARIRAEHLCRELLQLAFVLTVVVMLAGQTAALGGDVFRTRGSAGATPAGSGTAAAPVASTIDTAKLQQQRAVDAINRTRQSVAAAQKAAHDAAAALKSTIADGLKPGGLEPLRTDLSKLELWKGADEPKPIGDNAKDIVITQTQSQALLTWKTFNISKDTTLTFDQSAGGANASQWIAFNFVRDLSKSQILGTLKTTGAADAKGTKPVGGQVYVINPNGILFGNSSTVNVHGLVASTLPINSGLIQRGLLDNPDAQFLFSALALPAGKNGTPAFDPAVATAFAPVQTPGLEGYGDVEVKAGAQLTAPASSDHIGGRIALIGANVINAGTISTEDGQTILAAGLQVGLAAHNSSDPTLRGLDVYVGKVADIVKLPKQPDAGTVTNAAADSANNTPAGLISAPRGNVFMTGKAVQQLGFIDSSTSVAYNGRVDLLASYNAVTNTAYYPSGAGQLQLPFVYPSPTKALDGSITEDSTGPVNFGEGSVVSILPEWASTDSVVGDLALRSVVNVLGRSIHIAPRATILAPAAGVSSSTIGIDGMPLDAGVSLRAGSWFLFNRDSQFAYWLAHEANEGSQIYLDTSAEINVAGTMPMTPAPLTSTAGDDSSRNGAAPASVADTIVSVELRGNEFKDSPLQRDGVLRGQTVQVDSRNRGAWDPKLNEGKGGYAWVGTPLADATGWVNLTQHSIGRLTTDGGTVSLKSGGALVLKPGSTIDVSGGFTQFDGGRAVTTKLLSNGHVLDISQASADLVYDGIYSGGAAPDSQPGYIQGGNGGSLVLQSSALALDGTLTGRTVAGAWQGTVQSGISASAATPQWLIAATNRPLDCALTVNVQALLRTGPKEYTDYSPTPATVRFTTKTGAAGANPIPEYSSSGIYGFLGKRGYEIDLDPSLFGTDEQPGFARVTINNGDDNSGVGTGNIAIDTDLKLPAWGALSLSAANLAIADGVRVTAPSGTLAFSAYDVSNSTGTAFTAAVNSGQQPKVPYDATRGGLSVGTGVVLSTAGLVADGRRSAVDAGMAAQPISGGSISLKGSVVGLGDTSLLDVSGGVAITASGKLTYGSAGKITLEAGQSVQPAANTPVVYGGELSVGNGARLAGFAGLGKSGGTLSLVLPGFRVEKRPEGSQALWWNDGRAGVFDPGYFGAGGFGSFSVKGLGTVVDAAGKALPAAGIGAVDLAAQARSRIAMLTADGVDWTERLFEPGVRQAVALTFANNGLLKDANGLSINNDYSLALAAGGSIATDAGGKVTLSGGTVDLLGAIAAHGGAISVTATYNDVSTPSLHLGPAAKLDASGTTVFVQDAYGYHANDVLAGGTIALSGNLVAEASSPGGPGLNVSGSKDWVSIVPSGVGATSTSFRSNTLVPTYIESDGGTITLTGQRGLLTAATLLGRAGGTSAQGGSLSVKSNLAEKESGLAATALALLVQQTTPEFQFKGFGLPVLDSTGKAFENDRLISFGIDGFSGGGFTSLELATTRGALSFVGHVEVQAGRSLVLGDGGVISLQPVKTGDTVTLTAPRVVLGKSMFTPPSYGTAAASPFSSAVSPKYGDGRLLVNASQVIDVGSLSLQNGRFLSLDAGTGDIRGAGTLDMAGNIDLRAGQIYPVSATVFNIAAYGDGTTGAGQNGVITIGRPAGAGLPALPYSAGGSLNLYASTIQQGGVLRAPMGTIHLGVAGRSAPVDLLTKKAFPTTQSLILTAGSVTSVSAVDPTTGQAAVLPYGLSTDGTTWTDPTGRDITNAGLVAKAVTLAADQVDQQSGAVIDLTGGGDLYAYSWVSGKGGSKDILSSTSCFAIIPGYSPAYAPVAANASSSMPGYENSELAVGSVVHLADSAGLAAGYYTLLPARYALLAGAFLVTPQSGSLAPVQAVARADGSVLVAGYRANGLEPVGDSGKVLKTFEVVTSKVVRARAEYTDLYATTFFAQVASKTGTVSQRLPIDAGQLVYDVATALKLQGTVKAAAVKGGLGGLVDISSQADIWVLGQKALAAGTAPSGALVLSADALSGFGAESLLIGGVRQTDQNGTTVSVRAGSLMLDNAGDALTGKDVILAARQAITLAGNAELSAASDPAFVTEPLQIGNKDTAGSGNGVAVRVSSDSTASVDRAGVGAPATGALPAPVLTIGTGAKLQGAALVLDSTATVNLDPKAVLSGQAVGLASGRMSVVLDEGRTLQTTGSLVLSGGALQSLQTSATKLSLLSYSSIDLYGTGTIGSPAFADLELQAGELRGFDSAGGQTITAKRIALGNRGNVTSTGSVEGFAGKLTFDAGQQLVLGPGVLGVNRYKTVELKAPGGLLIGAADGAQASSGVVSTRSGGLAVQQDLVVSAPVIVGAPTSTGSITAGGALTLENSGTAATVTPGFGAKLTLAGAKITSAANVLLPGGALELEARTGDLRIDAGSLDVGGTTRDFFDVTKAIPGGSIALRSVTGDVVVAPGSTLNVAGTGDSDAGSVTIGAPAGSVNLAGTLSGRGGPGGRNGSFSIDTGNSSGGLALAQLALADWEALLSSSGFTRDVSFRVRHGNVLANGTAQAHAFTLQADAGKIDVTGTIDASSATTGFATGGMIDLAASGSVILGSAARLTVRGTDFDSAGKGGSVTLEAGSAIDGVRQPGAQVNLIPGSAIDLWVDKNLGKEGTLDSAAIAANSALGKFNGTLHLRAPQTANGKDVQIASASLGDTIRGASSVVVEGFRVYDLKDRNGIVDSAMEATVSAGAEAFAGGSNGEVITNRLLAAPNSSLAAVLHIRPGAELINTIEPSSTVTSQFVTLNSITSATTAGSSIGFTVATKSTSAPVLFVSQTGGLPLNTTINVTGLSDTCYCTVTYSDGAKNKLTAKTVLTSSVDKAVVSLTFTNTSTAAQNPVITHTIGVTPITVAVDPATTVKTTKAGVMASYADDIVLPATWDLSSYRFGPLKEPGMLTLRAKGNLVFNSDASLSDGFDTAKTVDPKIYPLWMATLQASDSWSYRLVAGADYHAAGFRQVLPLAGLAAADSGSVLVGQGSPALPDPTSVSTAPAATALVPQYFQTIRTGTGAIDIIAGRDVRLLNPLATIYTAGRQAPALDDFDIPVLAAYPARYSMAGGNVSIAAQQDFGRYLQDSSGPVVTLVADSSKEMPTNWLYRRGCVDASGVFSKVTNNGVPISDEIQSTSWWIDFSNFFADVGALGGGNVTLATGRDIRNIDAAVPTNARIPKGTTATSALVELGGGDLTLRAGGDIDGGVYYVEKGAGSLSAGGAIKTNATRAAVRVGDVGRATKANWLPTTLFLGKGSFEVAAAGDVLLGPVANPFLMPQGSGNGLGRRTYFSTYAPDDSVMVTSLGGTVTLKNFEDGTTSASLPAWYQNVLGGVSSAANPALAYSQPWLQEMEANGDGFKELFTAMALMPATLKVAAFSGDITMDGRFILSPYSRGTLELLGAGSINGIDPATWVSASINLSDANPASLPGIGNPVSISEYTAGVPLGVPPLHLLASFNSLFAETGATNAGLATKQALHGTVAVPAPDGSVTRQPLHYEDLEPVRLYAGAGDLSGLALFSGKPARVLASQDITDIGLYVQNLRADDVKNHQGGDVTTVAAGRDIVAYDSASLLQQAASLFRQAAIANGVLNIPNTKMVNTGDIQIAGPGTLEVLAGRNLDLGTGASALSNGTGLGITSIGSTSNPYLPSGHGADIVAIAGAAPVATTGTQATAGLVPGLDAGAFQFDAFAAKYLDASSPLGVRYLPVLAGWLDLPATTPPGEVRTAFGALATDKQSLLLLDLFARVLRDAGRDRNDPKSASYRSYAPAYTAIGTFVPGSLYKTKPDDANPTSADPAVKLAGDLSMSTRLIKTFEGGDITILAPGGGVTVGRAADPQTPDQGILTQSGGNISIVTQQSVAVGTSRIFTLRGGNELIWASLGDIAAGSGSKTVAAAPPTRVLIDPASADVQNDLAGLATGSGIGVLATLKNVAPGDIDLLAPVGTIDAGDAGIRSSGNLNIASLHVANAANIATSGASAGVPAAVAPSITAPAAPPPPTNDTNSGPGGSSVARAGERIDSQDMLSLIQVEVIRIGGSDEDEKDDKDGKGEKEGDTDAAQGAVVPDQAAVPAPPQG